MRKKWLPPIEWHRESLSNMIATLAYRETELARMRAEVERLRTDTEFYQRQIEEAERSGKTEFDRDRFLKSRDARIAT